MKKNGNIIKLLFKNEIGHRVTIEINKFNINK